MEPIEVANRLGRWSAGRGPLYLLLAGRLRALIDTGELAPGTRLPTDRGLAKALAVGRNTVVAAYELLSVEERVVRRQGSGTRVAGEPVDAPPDTTGAPAFLQLLEPEADVIALACAAPNTPPTELVEAYLRAGRRLGAITADIGYHPMGIAELRSVIADRYRARGVPTEAGQILVTGGGQQALSLIARAFLRPGDRVLVEAPTYPGALEVFREVAAVPESRPIGLGTIPVGQDCRSVGPKAVSAGRGSGNIGLGRAALAYVVATCHNPTGSSLSDLARRRLIESAAAAGVPVVDDEVLADLLFPGIEVPKLLAAYDDSIISIGSLSKIVWGGLRIGWVRAPVAVIARLGRLRAVHDLGGNIPAQLAAVEVIPQLDVLTERIAVERKESHDLLRAELAARLPEWEVPEASGGQTLWIRLPHGDGTSFAQRALRHGVAILPGTGLDAAGSADRIRISFVAAQQDLREAARRLATAWATYEPPREPLTLSPPLSV
ncbi:aminotransferase class I/II-fold pyridoxal phosphate-dependent enzyme [Nocardia sp. SYP-A9097]|uniref:aminotransferase-like domain-containing protein n=1 Tax=Nocardia sp. SYP-A9097 TaxID=2663237 RepID=UPI00129BBDB3|nr:PLP-dependent aminotransferase family protein [Nocardia sp. SYP-A9097]MRH93283.1 aminotransferase class I/II-fold pyridoxal phosphate-dependent enzyme [Nocardia sp. SYP-A9097]